MSKEYTDDPKQGRPDAEFPAFNFPVVFADGVLSHVDAMGQTKFYLYRIEPNMFGKGGVTTVPTVQIVMPTHGFMAAASFFYQRIQGMIAKGDISQADWDDAIKKNEPNAAPGP